MKSDPQSDIRAAFKRRRVQLGMTIAAMASMLDIHPQAYKRIESSSILTPELRAQLDKALTELETEFRAQQERAKT